jgi:hypothetical protein
LSKLISDLVDELKFLDEVEDDFECYLLALKIDDEGEITSTEYSEPLGLIGNNSEHQECLFTNSANDIALTVADVKKELSTLDPDYLLCATLEKTEDGSSIKVECPVIGFGENIDLKRFFLVCEVY